MDDREPPQTSKSTVDRIYSAFKLSPFWLCKLICFYLIKLMTSFESFPFNNPFNFI